MSMIFGASKAQAEIVEAIRMDREHLSGAVFPLAMLSNASPGAMPAIVILTENRSNTLVGRVVTAGLLVLVLLITLALWLAVTSIHRLIGNTGAAVISRIMGIVLATIGGDPAFGGFDTLDIFEIAPTPEGNPLEVAE